MENDYRTIGNGNMQLKERMEDNIHGEMNLILIGYLHRVWVMIDLLHLM